jgi:YidC/Oxa1 family membrane protein insertase
MTENRNTILAIVLSLVILVGWEMFFAPKNQPKQPLPVTADSTKPVTQEQAPPGPPLSGVVSPPAAVPSPGGDQTPARESAVASETRLRINTPRLHGSISLTGLRFDDVTLANFHETPDPQSPEITLLSPGSAPKPYYAEIGWIPAEAGTKVPTAATVWTADSTDTTLTAANPLVVHWDNGEGLRFTRTIRADADFLFTVEQTVANTTEKAVSLYPYSLVTRFDTPKTAGFYILFEGPLGVFDGTKTEMKYDDLKKKGRQTFESIGGWVGITDKYWLTTVALDQTTKVAGSFNHTMAGDRDRYQNDLRGDAIVIAPGETKSTKSYVFAGAKEVQLLDRYAKDPGIVRFDLAVDWGWFYFLTKPFFYALNWLRGEIGNFGLAILVFTTGLRLLMFPIANKQYAAMNKMKLLQPQMKALQERYADDRTKLNTELMELYRREKANPVAGCLPIVIQIPVFFALYKVLFVTIEMRHAPFYGWIKDLSAPDATNIFTAFGLIPFTPPDFLHLGALPIIMGITMFLQQKLSPQPADPIQARMMMFLPIIFTFMLASFPAGLVIYWTWSNLLGILQQWVLMRRTAPEAKK